VASVVSGDFWKMLAAEHVQHVTLAFADESDGWRRTLGSIDSASRANATPDVYTLAPGDLENCRTPSQLARLHGMPKLKAVLERRLHGYRLAANDIIARHKNGPHWTDAGLIDALYEAVRFDSGVTRSDEKAKLERFFWKTILDSTGGDSEMVERLLHRRFAHLEQAEEDPKVSRYRRLPADLSAALDADNVTRFEDLILQTARDIERDRRPVAANPLRWEPPRTWQPPEPERKDEPWQSEEFVSAQEETLRYEPPPPQLQPREPVVSRHYTYTTGSYPTGNGTAGRSYSPGDVRLAAYYLWENRGRPVGQEEELWFEAERRLRQGAAV